MIAYPDVQEWSRDADSRSMYPASAAAPRGRPRYRRERVAHRAGRHRRCATNHVGRHTQTAARSAPTVEVEATARDRSPAAKAGIGIAQSRACRRRAGDRDGGRGPRDEEHAEQAAIMRAGSRPETSATATAARTRRARRPRGSRHHLLGPSCRRTAGWRTCPEPPRPYCLPSIAYVIGAAMMPEPAMNFHSVCPVWRRAP